EGKTHTDTEALAIIKTTADTYPTLATTLAGLHPYETPEIIALPPSHASPTYAKWVSENASPTLPPS
ncbi:MAG: divalent cation tolerance protein CutA, partial [Verrucomicrobiales bacterium]|nr:divalent cation tolerance protein CutA [Verrucomicrobiales bacterium]